MTTPKPQPPQVPTPARPPLTADSIAKSGESLTRLVVAAVTLPLTVFNAIGTSFTNTISGVTAALDGTPASQNSNEIGKATGDLIDATTGLFQAVINAAAESLESAARAINAAVEDPGTTKPK